MKQNKKKKGFTLIELMAVIAIIAVLAAVLVPTVNGYIERSKKTALITQIRNVVNAVEVYNSTAPTEDKIEYEALSQLIPAATREASPAPALKQNFINQNLLSRDDVSKLNESITYDVLKVINSDENSMNNIYKQSGKFYYSNSDEDIDIDPTLLEK